MKALDLLAIKKLCEAISCQQPRFKSAEYVTRDMAIDAGDSTMEGTLLRDSLYEPCQDCNLCLLRILVPHLVTALEEAQKIVDILKPTMNLGMVQVPPPIQDHRRLYALKDAINAYDAILGESQ